MSLRWMANIYDFMFFFFFFFFLRKTTLLPLDNVALPNWGFLLKKTLASKGANSFLSELTSLKREAYKNKNSVDHFVPPALYFYIKNSRKASACSLIHISSKSIL